MGEKFIIKAHTHKCMQLCTGLLKIAKGKNISLDPVALAIMVRQQGDEKLTKYLPCAAE